MSGIILCKSCNDTIDGRSGKLNCRCGKVSISLDKDGNLSKVMHGGDRDNYAMVDDEGSELVVNEREPTTDESFEILMIGIRNEIDAMARSSPDRKFAPATNQDLLNLQEWTMLVAGVLKRMIEKSQ